MVPLLNVADMTISTDFYVAGLGFNMINEWRVDGDIRWCQLDLHGAGLMLQLHPGQPAEQNSSSPIKGQGVSFCIFCDDAISLYHQFIERGIDAREPIVGNALWVTSITDPDGYRVDFESPTEVAEETRLSEIPS
jgi:hypothetical protein